MAQSPAQQDLRAGGTTTDSAGHPQPPANPTAHRRVRNLAWGGLAFVALLESVNFGAFWTRGLALASLSVAVMGCTVCAACLLTMPRATRTLLAAPDLLVPVVLFVSVAHMPWCFVGVPLLGDALTWLLTLGFDHGWPARLPVQILGLAVSALLATWAAHRIVARVTGSGADLSQFRSDALRRFPRGVVVCAIGWGVPFLASLILWQLSPRHASAVERLEAISALQALVWNLATAAVLLFAVVPGRSVCDALGAGFRWSVVGARRWIAPVVAHMLLAGWVVHLDFEMGGFVHGLPGVDGWGSRFELNGFWTGAFEGASRWYWTACTITGTPTVPAARFAIELLLVSMAVVVKIHIAHHLVDAGAFSPAPRLSDDPRPA